MESRPSPDASLTALSRIGLSGPSGPRGRPATPGLSLLSACLGMGLLLACAGPPPKARTVCGACEGADRFVQLHKDGEATRQAGHQDFSHPFRLPPQDWKPILKNIQVRKLTAGFLVPGPKGPQTPAFTDDEVEYLGVTLSKAFEQARADELVVFGLTRQDSPQVTEVTTGAWFVTGPHLHLVLANYRNAVTMAGIKELLWKDPLRPNAGPFFELVPGDHQTLVPDTQALESLLGTPGMELAIAYQPLLLGEPAAPSTPPPGQAAPALPPPPSALSVEERLQALKRWKDQGLITDEDYRLKKQQLLDRF